MKTGKVVIACAACLFAGATFVLVARKGTEAVEVEVM